MKAKPKLFLVTDFEAQPPGNRRLIRAQTQNQVEKFLDGEVVKAMRVRTLIKIADVNDAVELGAAGVKVEDIPEVA